jgi:hypothetical protein
MKAFQYIALALVLISGLAGSASAYSFRLEIVSTGTVDGHAGYVVRVDEPPSTIEELFFFLESGQVRFYASREVGLAWETQSSSLFLTPPVGAVVGTSWNFLPDELGDQIATLEAFESITTAAGTFSSVQCVARYLVDSSVNEIAHFSSGTGLIREYFVNDLVVDELANFNIVGGSGYFPLAVGNWWEFEGNVSAVDELPATPNLLYAAVPNPFNPATEISFEMAASGHARLSVYDASGRLIRTLLDGQRDAGRHNVTWNGRDDTGRAASAGVYLYRFEAGNSVQTRRMTLIK